MGEFTPRGSGQHLLDSNGGDNDDEANEDSAIESIVAGGDNDCCHYGKHRDGVEDTAQGLVTRHCLGDGQEQACRSKDPGRSFKRAIRHANITATTVLNPPLRTSSSVLSKQAEADQRWVMPGKRSLVFITRHTRLGDVDLRDRLWEFYRRSYANNPLHPFTELVNRSEFDECLLNSTNRVWVVWEENRPVVMTLIATDITATRWLNPDYFRRNYADRMKKGLVHYVMWVVVDPDVEIRGANIALAKEALAAEARDGAFLVFDLPDTHQPTDERGAAALMLRMARIVGDVQLVPLSAQRFYALDFTANPVGADRDVTNEQARSVNH